MACHRRLKRLQDIGGDAYGDSLGGCPYRVAREVRIARSRLDIAMPEQLADHWQGHAECQRPGRESVA